MGFLDSMIFGTPQPSQIGSLSALASTPITMPSLVPTMRLGSPTGGLAPGNGWGDAPTTTGGATPMIGGIPNMSAPASQPATTDDDDKGPSTGQRWAGILGDALLTAFGHQPVYGPTALAYAKMQDSPAETALKLAQAHAYMRPDHQVVNLGNGGVGQWDSDTGFSMVRQPDAPAPKQTPLEENIALYRKLNPTATDADVAAMVQRGIQGYQYDPTYMAQRQANTLGAIDARGAQARTTKGTPTYAGLHPRSPGGGASGGVAGGMTTRDLLSSIGR